MFCLAASWSLCSPWSPEAWLQTRTFYNLTSNSPIIVYHQSLNISLFLHLSQGQNGVNFTQVTLGQVSSRFLFSFLSILENSSSKALMDLALRLPPVTPFPVLGISAMPDVMDFGQLCTLVPRCLGTSFSSFKMPHVKTFLTPSEVYWPAPPLCERISTATDYLTKLVNSVIGASFIKLSTPVEGYVSLTFLSLTAQYLNPVGTQKIFVG